MRSRLVAATASALLPGAPAWARRRRPGVPITQSFEMYRALSDKVYRLPDEQARSEDAVHQADIDRRYIEWFKRYLQ